MKCQLNGLSCNSLLKTIDATIDHRGAKNAKLSKICSYLVNKKTITIS